MSTFSRTTSRTLRKCRDYSVQAWNTSRKLFVASCGLYIIACFMPTGTLRVRADDSDLRRRVEAAVDLITENQFNNCILRIESKEEYVLNGSRLRETRRNSTFAKVGNTVFADTSLFTQIYAVDGQPVSEGRRSYQDFVTPKGPAICTKYSLIGNDKKSEYVAFAPLRGYDKDYFMLLAQTGLEHLMSNFFGPHAVSLRAVVRAVPETIRADGDSVIASYRTEYGLTTITTTQIAGQDVPSEIKVVQLRDDRYTSLGKEKLSDMHESVFEGEQAAGLDKCILNIKLHYGTGSVRVSSWDVRDDWHVRDEMSAPAQHLMNLTQYVVQDRQECRSPADIEAMRVSIPNGSKVMVIGRQSRSIDFMWHNGAIVRRVDAKAVADLPVRSRSNVWYRFSWPAGVMLLCLALYAYRLWSRRRSSRVTG